MVGGKTLKLIDQYLELLKQEGITVQKAFIFGSQLNGKRTKSSDIDLLIVSENLVENDDQLMGKIWSLTRKISTRIEPYIIGSSRFSESSDSPLIQEVKQSGFEVVVKG
ncbi:Predicted nucleotidyltransferase [Cyclobacterium xiamenense]|uniref:Predicted nucleotidyltransferase n=1 Tax=Cyclobacterium xiamenense TaxID=1297121 RepID=A0A1H6ZGD4_9BACT|nr:nucleotidyltransferase domain-containing protein [Cyclobacterium xiamenense]SEJ50567.1 Predicted nucleotidyltransferase [Cyclobacterium xiamenense]